MAQKKFIYAVVLPDEAPQDLKNNITGFYQDFNPKIGFITAPSDNQAVNQYLHRIARQVFPRRDTAKKRAKLVFDAFDTLPRGPGTFAYCLNPEVVYESTDTRASEFRQSWLPYLVANEIADKRSVAGGQELRAQDCLTEAINLLEKEQAERAKWFAQRTEIQ